MKRFGTILLRWLIILVIIMLSAFFADLVFSQSEMHCPDHESNFKFEGQGIGHYGDITFEVSGRSVLFDASEDIEFCVKAGEQNSGRVSGIGFIVDWENNGGQIPDISYIVIYEAQEVTPTITNTPATPTATITEETPTPTATITEETPTPTATITEETPTPTATITEEPKDSTEDLPAGGEAPLLLVPLLIMALLLGLPYGVNYYYRKIKDRTKRN